MCRKGWGAGVSESMMRSKGRQGDGWGNYPDLQGLLRPDCGAAVRAGDSSGRAVRSSCGAVATGAPGARCLLSRSMGQRMGGQRAKRRVKRGVLVAGVLLAAGMVSPAFGAVKGGTGPARLAMLEWPRTDTGEPAPISEAAMSALVVERLRQAGIAEEDFGLAVVPLGLNGAEAVAAAGEVAAGARFGGTPLLKVAHQSGRPFNPASTMKLVTTYAALSMLGPDYRWTTRFYTTGPIRNGVLQGDLVMQGGGDPHLVIEDLHALMADLRAQGLTTIRGNLVIDDSRFAVGPAYGSAFDGDASQAYNVRPWAALTNFKASKLVVDPKSKQLVLDPPLADVQLRYEVKVLRGRCRGGATRVSVADGATPAGRPQVAVNGTQVRACGPLQFYAAMLDHQQFVHGIFKAAWKNMGGQFLGRTRIEPGAAKRARPLYAWQSSLDLGEVVHQINKFSNNVMTRMLLLEMAAAKGQGALAPEVAGQWLHGWYRSQGMPMASLTMENGSGLSRQARISAGDMVVLLARAAQSPQARWFEQSLPVVGIDGTMKTRLRLDPVAGQAQIKTGTLQEVRAIAGYVTAASGRRYALSLMINGKYPAERALHAQDELLRWVYRHG